MRWFWQVEHLDLELREALNGHGTKKHAVSERSFATYRFVDLFEAVETLAAEASKVERIDAGSREALSRLLHVNASDREVAAAERREWAVSRSSVRAYPDQCFWVLEAPRLDGGRPVVVRIRYMEWQNRLTLEVASQDAATADATVRELDERSARLSIHRGALLAVIHEPGRREEYGDPDEPSRVRLSFKVADALPRERFVVDDGVHDALWRNTVDLFRRRDALRRHGVPIKRGVLLYGPPGTGKTYACRYLCGALPDVTRIVVAGNALPAIGTAFDLARLYQPSLVILEDVDLAFAARDINARTTELGDLMDRLDGMRPDDEICTVLTTNSIERMESAIKDRPGRISQCIRFDPPDPRLRRRYIEHYLEGRDRSGVDIDLLVNTSSGVTAAFVKEWVHRAIQFALEADGNADELHLRTEDFDKARLEMTRHADDGGGRIVGFVG